MFEWIKEFADDALTAMHAMITRLDRVIALLEEIAQSSRRIP